jgi:tRNA(Ile)-lysidine synthase
MCARPSHETAAKETALDEAAIAAAMERLGGFEPAPRVAVAVSGGADSMALTLLLDGWARQQGGRIVAFTVDHGLRPESTREAAAVGAILRERGIRHEVLPWQPDESRGNLQAQAREARYRLLTDACRRHRILHLALAHHRDDQAETLLLRLARGSGLDGLAAMPAISFASDLRVLRPLLDVPKAALKVTCRRFGVEWFEDPSNESLGFARVRLRRALPALEAEGITAERLADTAVHLGRARQALERDVGVYLARAASLSPAGYLWLRPEILCAAPSEVALRALTRILMTVGGGNYPPRFNSLERLYRNLVDGLPRGRTLGGCRILPRQGRWLFVREAAAAEERAAPAGARLVWDGRFLVSLGAGVPSDARLAPLGQDGWRQALEAEPAFAAAPIPAPARAALPAIFMGQQLLETGIPGYLERGKGPESLLLCRLRPKVALCPQAFTVAFRSGHII